MSLPLHTDLSAASPSSLSRQPSHPPRTAAFRRLVWTLSLLVTLAAGILLWPRAAQAEESIHVVRPGDTLSAIAKTHNVSLRELANSNGVSNQNFIFTGQRLVIPSGLGEGVSATVARAALPASSGYHTVARGDMLSQVARRYSMDLADLMRLNGLTDPNLIWVGQKLRVTARVAPADQVRPDKPELASSIYVMKEGDTLEQIAKEFNTNIYSLMQLNGLPNTDFTWAGQTLRIGAGDVAVNSINLVNAPADGRKLIEVNLSNQTLTAWQGNVAVLHTNISGGTSRTPTVTGRYAVGTKYSSQRMSGPGYDLPGVPWVMYFYSGYAIHGTYWHNNFGTPMSRGCVNMRISEAQFLYNWAPAGTEVYVHY